MWQVRLYLAHNGCICYESNLKLVRLDHNLIEAIDVGAFSSPGPSDLTVDISYNLLTEIPPYTFGTNGSNIVRLSLGKNHITEISKGAFYKLHAVYTLYLDFNKISRIEPGSFDDLTSLAVLGLSGNKLLSINEYLFPELIRLSSLDLSMNSITSINDGSFRNNSALRAVNFQNNSISIIANDNFIGTRCVVPTSFIGLLAYILLQAFLLLSQCCATCTITIFDISMTLRSAPLWPSMLVPYRALSWTFILPWCRTLFGPFSPWCTFVAFVCILVPHNTSLEFELLPILLKNN